ncbi:5-dehydro-2-deoxygluconokinase [Pelagibius litoralis]|uniref:5-dehydro-2-deoxygluconokinase n=1 Tax=Pelagibius litoralis TaxID=374515 RepID=A0A967EYI1_9PROT|nr:5-dehydro-2-deoxygluconokinase [Pelagibius litoralis]NIA69773.1 5-dehydro-2-deoxygluconokinase [Pelagibius litoralis]
MAAPLAIDRLDRSRPFGALVLGRAGLDLYPAEDGGKIAEAAAFTSDLGGSAGNIAVALARQGVKTGLLTALSDDPVGRFVRQRLEAFEVDTRYVRSVAGDPRTSLALAEVRDDDCEVTIYRNNAADLQLTADEELLAGVAAAGALIVTGTALVANPSRAATLALLEAARAAGTVTVFDLDYRAYAWTSREETSAVYGQAAGLSDLIVGNSEEFAVFANDGNGEAAASALAAEEDRLAILKRGGEGASVLGPGWRIDSGVFPVTALKPYGAGDAFMGGLVAALLKGAALEEAIRRGSAAAAMVVSRRGCASAMPDSAELTTFLSSQTMTSNPTRV